MAAVLLPCCPERVTAYLAVVKAGLIYAPVSLDEPLHATSRRLGLASPTVCITLAAHAHRVPPRHGANLVLLDAMIAIPSLQPRGARARRIRYASMGLNGSRGVCATNKASEIGPASQVAGNRFGDFCVTFRQWKRTCKERAGDEQAATY